jgi:uncharacterized protein
MTALLVSFLAVFAGTFTQGCTGFGMALIAAPSLMLVLPPRAAVPVVILLSLINTVLVALDARKQVRLAIVGPLALGGAVGVFLGVQVLANVNPGLIKAFVGAGVMVFAVMLFFGWQRPVKNQKAALLPVGAASGALGASMSIGGPPVILFLSNQDLPRDAFRANLIAHFAIMNCLALIGYVVQGFITCDVLEFTAFLVPAMLAGTFIGIRLARHVPELLFKRIAVAIVFAMGLTLLITSIES